MSGITTPEKLLQASKDYNDPFWVLSVRTYGSLANANIKTVDQLIRYTPAQLLRLPRLGKKALKEIQRFLADRQLSLATVPTICPHCNGTGRILELGYAILRH